MYDKVTGFHLLQFLHRERHLSCTCRTGTEAVLVEAFEYLVVGEEAHSGVIVHESCMKRLLHLADVCLPDTLWDICFFILRHHYAPQTLHLLA